MKINALAVAAAIAATGAIPAAATAAPIKECGNFVLTGNDNHGYWTYRLVYGYTPVFNLTTRNVSCSYAVISLSEQPTE